MIALAIFLIVICVFVLFQQDKRAQEELGHESWSFGRSLREMFSRLVGWIKRSKV
jgi:hypothetical protein